MLFKYLIKSFQGYFIHRKIKFLGSSFMFYPFGITFPINGSLNSKWSIVCSDLEVDYGSEDIASMIYAALAVDKEVIIHDSQAHYL